MKGKKAKTRGNGGIDLRGLRVIPGLNFVKFTIYIVYRPTYSCVKKKLCQNKIYQNFLGGPQLNSESLIILLLYKCYKWTNALFEVGMKHCAPYIGVYG